MKKSSRKVTVVLACFALLMSQSPLASARLGSQSSGAVARPAPSGAQYQSSGRLGAGQSAGMQRPQVMQSVRTPPPSAPAPVAAQAPGAAFSAAPAPAGAPAAAPGPGTPGWVKPALAGAAVGALAGYALSNHNAAPAGGNGSVGANANYGPPAAGSGALAGAASQGSSGMGGFGVMLLLLLLAGAAYFFWRKNKASGPAQLTPGGYGKPSQNLQAYEAAPGFSSLAPAPSLVSLNAPADLVPLQAFRSLQDFNSFGNKEALRQVTTREMFAVLEPSVGSAPLHILSLSADVQDITQEAEQTVVSVRYKGTVSEGANLPEPIDEVWHFVKPRSAGGNWLLAGIEQV